MHENDLSAAHDQARKLRQLAQPGAGVPPRPATSGTGPHCILLAEFPAQGRSAPLGWFLANELLRRLSRVTVGARGLLVDLAPAASRMRGVIERSMASGLGEPPPTLQPLWQETAHGRVLRKWEPLAGRRLDVVAQTDNVLPSPVQYQRINEQLIRQLACPARWGQPQYDVTVLCAAGDGIPLDAACWQAADDILVVWSPELCEADPLKAQLNARIPSLAATQRIGCVYPAPSGLLGWLSGRSKGRAPASDPPPDHSRGDPASAPVQWYAQWNVPLVPWPTTGMHMRQYRRAARRIAGRLSRMTLEGLLPRRAG